MTAAAKRFEPPATQLSPARKAEIEDRIGQLERREVEPVAWEQVEAKIRATLMQLVVSKVLVVGRARAR